MAEGGGQVEGFLWRHDAIPVACGPCGAGWSASARQADGLFGADRPIVRILTVEQFAGAGWQPRSSEG
jgi:hypothetical protein